MSGESCTPVKRRAAAPPPLERSGKRARPIAEGGVWGDDSDDEGVDGAGDAGGGVAGARVLADLDEGSEAEADEGLGLGGGARGRAGGRRRRRGPGGGGGRRAGGGRADRG